jgi:hypothetical protein
VNFAATWAIGRADALRRNAQLTEELHQAQGQIRSLQDRLFGRKSEKSARSDRSNDLFDPEEVAAVGKRRGAQPGQAGHDRRDYSHLPVEEESVPWPATMFSFLATLARWKINPRRWLTWYLESCAVAGGKTPEDIQPSLPWNLSDERRLALGAPATVPATYNTS